MRWVVGQFKLTYYHAMVYDEGRQNNDDLPGALLYYMLIAL
jgi:hypothetical protein